MSHSNSKMCILLEFTVVNARKVPYNSDSQSMLSTLAASASSENLLEMQILSPTPE